MDTEKIDFLLTVRCTTIFNNEHLTIDEWPFDQPFYLILNIAIVGLEGGRTARLLDSFYIPQQMT